ncbi:testis-specific serine/threonine-protein kinase 3-like [Bolinopsis microptera]|uniref:testis-specific serine/threonine-protein kinase 3-like n=1 Tax=Bolinopsis microptera TaxID=2820187 RepID=UPI00307A1653
MTSKSGNESDSPTTSDIGLTSTHVPKPREKIPGYIFGDVIGTGAYAKVRRCYSEKFKSHVAVKIVSKKSAPKDYLTKFLPREIQCIHKLRHKNIVRVLEILETERSMYIVMQEAEKGDLLDFINANQRKIAENDAKAYFQQILEAVEHCHVKNIVHRDLKCENILFDKDMVIKLSDFGFARTINPESVQLKTHCGSLAYAAPEIVKGKDYDGRISDVWSLGVVLFAMVNGKLPFNDTSVKNLLAAINKGITFQSNVSEACRDLITAMLMTDCARRAKIKDLLKHSWFDPDASSTYRNCPTPSPREGAVARDEKHFIKTPNPSPMNTPRGTPEYQQPMDVTPGTSPCSTPGPYTTADEGSGEFTGPASEKMSVQEV